MEGLLVSHNDVLDSCVVGVYSEERAGEIPKAFVVVREGVGTTKEVADDIMKFVADRVAYYKQLKGGIEFVDVIPKTASGKILRRFLRDKAAKPKL